MARNATRFYSGTTTFWVDWDGRQVVMWHDQAWHVMGRGLPEGFTLTEQVIDVIGSYIQNYGIEIEIPQYMILQDIYKGTYDVLLPEWNTVIYSRISRNGNFVLLQSLTPCNAYRWLMAIVCDYRKLPNERCNSDEIVHISEVFDDLLILDEQMGNE